MYSSSRTEQIFVIGCPRSGTSALSWALAQHPTLWTSAESDFMHKMFKGNQLFNIYKSSVSRPDSGWLQQNEVTYREFASYIGMGIDALFRSRSRGLVWVDQTPGHTLVAQTLRELFPSAKFVHIVRDGRDVVRSMLNSNFEKMGFEMKWTTDFEYACNTWNTYIEKGMRFELNNQDVCIKVRNEDLTSNAEGVFGEVFESLGIAYNAAPASFISSKRLNSSYDTGFKSKQSNDTPASSGNSKWSDEMENRFWELCRSNQELLGYSSHVTESI